MPSVTAATAGTTGTRKSRRASAIGCCCCHGCHRLLLQQQQRLAVGGCNHEQGPISLPPRDGIQAPAALAVPHPQVRIQALSLHPCSDTPVSLTLRLHFSLTQAFCHVVSSKCHPCPATNLTGSIIRTGLRWLMPRELQELQKSSAPCPSVSMVLRRQGDSL